MTLKAQKSFEQSTGVQSNDKDNELRGSGEGAGDTGAGDTGAGATGVPRGTDADGYTGGLDGEGTKGTGAGGAGGTFLQFARLAVSRGCDVITPPIVPTQPAYDGLGIA